MTETAITRLVAAETLVELGSEYPDVVIVGGDLNKSTYSNKFGAEFPDRFFDFGPAEQNMVNVAAGLAASGKIPVVSTFAAFGTARPFDQLRVGVSQPGLNVKLILTHAGLLTAEDGASAQAIEDVAIISALPSFTVIVPADGPEAAKAVRAAVETEGPFYVRLSRTATPVVHGGDYTFAVGRAETMREGTDATIIACGIMVHAAQVAAESLAAQGISCRVVNMATVSPLDEAAVLSAARDTGALVTAEEHLLKGGLGSAVASVLSGSLPTPLEMVGLSGYAESGNSKALLEKYGLTSTDIADAVRRVVSRKTGQPTS
jgi:transketolase